MKDGKRCAAIVLAAGSGKRMGGNVPKQFMTVGDKPLLYYSLKTFQESFIDEIVVVTRQENIEYVANDIVKKYSFGKVTAVVSGGWERYHSVAIGLDTLENRDGLATDNDKTIDYVFIHDGARPFVTSKILEDSFDAVCKYGAVVAGVPSKDTVKILDENGFVIDTPNRNCVYIMQTPQVFDFADIHKCYSKLIEGESEITAKGIVVTDDAMVMELFGSRKVFISMGDYKNIKVTTPEDMVTAQTYLEEMK